MDIDRTVFTNLSRFKESLSKIPPGASSLAQREYKVLLDCKSGEMRFPKEIRDLQFSISSKSRISTQDWKDVRLIVVNENGNARFEIRDAQNHLLDSPDVKGVAKRTLEVLNGEAQKIRGVVSKLLPEQVALQNLTSIQVQTRRHEIESLPEWAGAMTFEEAEKKLENAPIGTYLIRWGDDVALMIDRMKMEYRCDIQPYSLTFAAEEKKISEILILQLPWGWIKYQDEPDLRSSLYTVYTSAQELLKSLNTMAWIPYRAKVPK